jgi:hypothetical protein
MYGKVMCLHNEQFSRKMSSYHSRHSGKRYLSEIAQKSAVLVSPNLWGCMQGSVTEAARCIEAMLSPVECEGDYIDLDMENEECKGTLSRRTETRSTNCHAPARSFAKALCTLT